MATTRKGWRRIAVDGQTFRWTTGKGGCWDDYPLERIRFIVESASGSLLIVNLERTRFDPWLDRNAAYSAPITPSEVARWIRKAQAMKWNAAAKGKPFVLHESKSRSFCSRSS